MEDQKSKNELFKDVLGWLGGAAIAYAIFKGMMYIYSNWWISGISGILIFAVITLLRYYLLNLKKKKDSYKNLLPEKIFAGIVIVIFISTLPVMLHYFDIEFFRVTEIKNHGRNKLKDLDNMIKSAVEKGEENISAYRLDVKNRLEHYLSNNYNNMTAWKELTKLFDGEGVDGENRIQPGLKGKTYSYTAATRSKVEAGLRDRVKNATETYVAFLRDKYNIEYLKSRNKSFQDTNLPIFENWQFEKVNYSLNEIDKHHKITLEGIQSIYPDFIFEKSVKSAIDISDPMYQFKSGNFGLILSALLVFGALYFILLIPYIFFIRFKPDVVLVDPDLNEQSTMDRKTSISEKLREGA